MRKLVVGALATLDGVVQAPGGPDEDRDGGFRHGGWLVPYFDAKFVDIMAEWTKLAGAFLLGRRTYEIFAGSWPKSTDPADEIATALNTRPKFVASRTLKKLDWNNSTLVKGEVAREVAKLKAQEGGEIQVHGSGNLLQTLLRHDLVDTLRIWQFPVVLGSGKRLFGEGTIPRSFRLVDTQQNTTGATLHVYERAGGLKYGEVEVGQEPVVFDSAAAPKITVETTVAAPIEEVWRAYTTPEDIKQWNAASDDWHTTAATVDLRPGGAFSSRMEAKDGSMGFDFAGTYTKIVKHQLIEYSFGDRAAQVEFAAGPQGVKVRVTFDSEPTHSVEQQREGWQAILNNFARHAEAGR